MPGVVLRVSRICVFVPATVFTHCEVSVAMPLKCPKKFSAVRSASKIPRAFPDTVINTVPLLTRSPSLTKAVASVTPTSASVAIAIFIPAITPSLRATNCALTFDSAESVAIEVISTPPFKSSAIARLINSRSIISG